MLVAIRWHRIRFGWRVDVRKYVSPNWINYYYYSFPYVWVRNSNIQTHLNRRNARQYTRLEKWHKNTQQPAICVTRKYSNWCCWRHQSRAILLAQIGWSLSVSCNIHDRAAVFPTYPASDLLARRIVHLEVIYSYLQSFGVFFSRDSYFFCSVSDSLRFLPICNSINTWEIFFAIVRWLDRHAARNLA